MISQLFDVAVIDIAELHVNPKNFDDAEYKINAKYTLDLAIRAVLAAMGHY